MQLTGGASLSEEGLTLWKALRSLLKIVDPIVKREVQLVDLEKKTILSKSKRVIKRLQPPKLL